MRLYRMSGGFTAVGYLAQAGRYFGGDPTAHRSR